MEFDPAKLMAALDTLGTLGLVALAFWAFYTRRIRVKSEVEDEAERHRNTLAEARAEHARQLAYIEERRHDERVARLAAEQRLEALVNSVEKVTDVMQAIQMELVRGNQREDRGHGGDRS